MSTNAVLTKITGPGAPDAYGQPATGADLWVGRAAGYLKRIRRSAISGGQQIPVRVDTFTILTTVGAPALEAAGADWEATTVVIEDRRTMPPTARRFRVKAMEHRAAGLLVDSVRLELEAEATP